MKYCTEFTTYPLPFQHSGRTPLIARIPDSPMAGQHQSHPVGRNAS